jgi:hypothetical protein
MLILKIIRKIYSNSFYYSYYFYIHLSNFFQSLTQNTTTDSFIAVTKSGQIKSSCELKIPIIQGPLYKEGSPSQKKAFAKGIEGKKIVITGKALNFFYM